jgi:hypothetical protein
LNRPSADASFSAEAVRALTNAGFDLQETKARGRILQITNLCPRCPE